ncbi:MAG: antitoxin Xre/MbcA/ParS toxin-binding domain-containing protein [Oleiphilaceae bacterium]|nr:antitoxin Xre/MbcA/ParS toxin-binding domain-containing protein [Oleiphilaceae bacterium]
MASIRERHEVYSPPAGTPDKTRDSLAAEPDLEMVAMVRKGASRSALKRLQSCLDIGPVEAARLLRISPRTLERRRGQPHLEPGETDRIVSVLGVFREAEELFGGHEDKARQWLKSPLPALGESRPLDLLDTETGTRLVRDLIGQLSHGVFV